MKLTIKRYINLEESEKRKLIENALEIDQEMSRDEFVDYIELLLSIAVDLVVIKD